MRTEPAPGGQKWTEVLAPVRALEREEFALFQRLLRTHAGIHLAEPKMALVQSRLAKRVRSCGVDSFGDYFKLITSEGCADELQTALDLLTTNETHFFREAAHYEFFRRQVLPQIGATRALRVWSAACSSGEEAYSAAMVIADLRGAGAWEVLGSDISSRVLAQAGSGQYSMARATEIPPGYLSRYCLKGVGRQAGTFAIGPELTERVKFMRINLNAPLPSIGNFDVIFLRNVMIYFDVPTKREVVQRVVPLLNPGGYLFIGHSESLHGVSDMLVPVVPAVYRLR